MRSSVTKPLRYWMLSVLLVLALSVSALAAEELVLLFTNDVHGRLESHIPRGAETEIGGLTRLASLVDEVRDANDNVLLFGAGDFFHGTNVANLFAGESVVDVMNAMGFSAMVLGNHEFNYNQDQLKALVQAAEFPVLAANVLYNDGTAFTTGVLMLPVGDLKVGIIGLTSQDTPILASPKNVHGLEFRDPVKYASYLAPRLRSEVDVLIALTHTGIEVDRQLAAEVPEFDVIVGGHSHTRLDQPEIVNGTLIVQAEEYANYLGFLKLTVDNGQITEYDHQLKSVTHETAAQQEIALIVEEYNAELSAELDRVIRYLNIELDGERAHVRTRETNLGNLIADAMLAAVDVDLAVTNGGGIRASLNAGPVTVGDLFAVLPFDNTLTILEVDGTTIKEMLEFSVRNLPEQNGGFLQVAGITFDVDSSKPAGERVSSVKVSGQPLDMKAKYRLATNDFLASGGDGYAMLADAKLLYDTGILFRDLLRDYFLSTTTIQEPVAGRINIR